MAGISLPYIIIYVSIYILFGLVSVGLYAKWVFPVAYIAAFFGDCEETYRTRLQEERVRERNSVFLFKKWLFFFIFPVLYVIIAVIFVLTIVIKITWQIGKLCFQTGKFFFNGFR